LPNMVGELLDTPWSCVYMLYWTALVLVVLSALLIVLKSRCEFEDGSFQARYMRVFSGMSGMGFAWCCLFGSRTAFLNSPVLEANGVGMMTISGRILLALTLSLLSTIAIFFLDRINDVAKLGSPPGKSPGYEIITQLVFAKSILVGFSWEHSFDGGVQAIANMTDNPLCTETCLAVFMFFVVVPSWRRHILRKAMMLQDYRKIQNKADLEGASGYTAVPTSPRSAGTSGDNTMLASPRSAFTVHTSCNNESWTNSLMFKPGGRFGVILVW